MHTVSLTKCIFLETEKKEKKRKEKKEKKRRELFPFQTCLQSEKGTKGASSAPRHPPPPPAALPRAGTEDTGRQETRALAPRELSVQGGEMGWEIRQESGREARAVAPPGDWAHGDRQTAPWKTALLPEGNAEKEGRAPPSRRKWERLRGENKRCLSGNKERGVWGTHEAYLGGL